MPSSQKAKPLKQTNTTQNQQMITIPLREQSHQRKYQHHRTHSYKPQERQIPRIPVQTSKLLAIDNTTRQGKGMPYFYLPMSFIGLS